MGKVAVALMVVLLTGCTSTTLEISPASSSASPSFSPLVRRLPTRPPPLPNEACGGVGVEAVLHGSPADPRVTWVEHFPDGGDRKEVDWPAGFTARFSPQLEVLDETGRVLMREGDFVEGTCGGGGTASSPYRLSPARSDGRGGYVPAPGYRLVCGPMPIDQCLRLNGAAVANGWPTRDIAEIVGFTVSGSYRLVYEDGKETIGTLAP